MHGVRAIYAVYFNALVDGYKAKNLIPRNGVAAAGEGIIDFADFIVDNEQVVGGTAVAAYQIAKVLLYQVL